MQKKEQKKENCRIKTTKTTTTRGRVDLQKYNNFPNYSSYARKHESKRMMMNKLFANQKIGQSMHGLFSNGGQSCSCCRSYRLLICCFCFGDFSKRFWLELVGIYRKNIVIGGMEWMRGRGNNNNNTKNNKRDHDDDHDNDKNSPNN